MTAYTLSRLKASGSDLVDIEPGTQVNVIAETDVDIEFYVEVMGFKVKARTPHENIVVFDSPLDMAGI